MARVVNPYNLDVDDDAVFAGALSQGLIWIEDGDDSYNDVPFSEMIDIEEISGTVKHTLEGHTSDINAITICDEFIISASSDKTLRVWNWKTGQLLSTLTGHTDSVNHVAINGDIAISASLDKTLRVWHWKTGQLLRTIDEFKYNISQIALNSEVAFTVSVSTIRIWNWKTGEFIQVYRDGTGPIVADDDLLLIIESSNSLRVKNWKTGETIHRIHVDGYAGYFFLKDEFAIFIDEFEGIRVWNWKTGDRLNESESLSKVTDQILHISLDLSFEGEVVHFYDAEANKCYYHLPEQPLKFTDDHSHIITSNEDGDIQVKTVAPFVRRLIEGKSETVQQLVESGTNSDDIDKVLEVCRNYIHHRNEKWVNFTRLSQHLHQELPNVDLRLLGQSNKRYKNLRYLLEDYPKQFAIRPDPEKQGLYWIQLKAKQTVAKSAKKEAKSGDIDVVLETSRNYIRKRNEKWVNFTRLSQHLHQNFSKLNVRILGKPDKSYKNFRSLIADYPSDFELRQDPKKQGLYWVRLKSKS